MEQVGNTTGIDVADEPLSDAAASRRRGFILLGVALVALTTTLVVWQMRPPGPATDLSVAVLPFENRSAARDDAYLAAGMQDEIVSLLGRSGALRVVSRNAAQRYAGSTAPPPRIGAELGVTYLLTGDVRRSGDALHVDATLVGAADRHQVWTTSYERGVMDAFAIESAVAQAVTEALRARRLTAGERVALTSPPTPNAAAYDAYLRARSFGERTARDEAEIRRVIAAYEEAVRLDPTFASAWSQLSRRQSSYFSLGYDRSEARRDAALGALENAERLAPDAVDTKAARAYYLFVVKEDLEGAERAVLELEKRFPSSPDIATGLAQITREMGRLDRSTRYARRAIASDPLNPYRQYQLCQDYFTSREIVLAAQTCDGALALLPGDTGILALEATIHQSRGELAPAREQLSGLEPEAGDWRTLRAMSRQLELDREPAAAVALLGKYLATPEALGTRRGVVRRWLADAQRQSGDETRARASYETARMELEAELAGQPANPAFLGELAIVRARLGDRAAAADLGQRCTQVALASHRTGYVADCGLARIQVALATPGLGRAARAAGGRAEAAWRTTAPDGEPAASRSRLRRLSLARAVPDAGLIYGSPPRGKLAAHSREDEMPRRLISSGSSFEKSIGYSRAVVDGDWIFVSGTTGFDYTTMTIKDDVVSQCEQAFRNIEAALKHAGSGLKDVVRVHYLLTNAAEFEACWPVMGQAFGTVRPSCTAMVVGLVDPRMKIEIEVTALKGKKAAPKKRVPRKKDNRPKRKK